MEDKRAQLLALARVRQATRWEGYNSIADYHDGVYECDYVSPYTKGAGNLDADVMVMLQDWASDENLRGTIDEDARVIGYTPRLPTNENLSRLLEKTFGLCLQDVYATNLFPFIKSGKMGGDIRPSALLTAAQLFALPQIRIVSPRVVICLGLATFNALERALQRPLSRNLSAAIANPFGVGESRVWCQAHTGVLGTNNRNRGGVERVSKDWLTMKLATGL
jgi:restriction system protein